MKFLTGPTPASPGRSRLSFGATAGLAIAATLVALVSAYLVVFAPILLALLLALVLGVALLAGGGWWAGVKGEHDRALAWDLYFLWLLAINLPAYTRFDVQGIVRPDLLNPQSIGRIVLTLMVAAGFVMNGLLRRRASRDRERVSGQLRWTAVLLPILLYAWYTCDTTFLARDSATSLLLALFRVFEWILYLLLVVRILNRYAAVAKVANPSTALSFAIPQCAFPVLLAGAMALLVPPLAFNPGESGVYRLQTPFTHSNVLGILAAAAFFYAVELKPSRYRWLAFISLLVLVATYSRGAWIGFGVTLIAWWVQRMKSGMIKIMAICALVIAVVGGAVARDSVLDLAATLLSRSRTNTEDVASASQRNLVWRYSAILVRQSPWLGHGYVVGPKKLIDLMAEGESGSYFRAPHAHNEFVQAQLNGGVIATLLTAALWIHLFWLTWRLGSTQKTAAGRVATAWVILCFVYGMLTPVTSERLILPATLVLFLYPWAQFATRATRPFNRDRNKKTQAGGRASLSYGSV